MIRPARVEDADEILALIYELAVYEKAPEEAKATVAQIHQSFFSPEPKVFCEIVEHDGQIAGFAIWFLNYSTWQGLHGIYLFLIGMLPPLISTHPLEQRRWMNGLSIGSQVPSSTN